MAARRCSRDSRIPPIGRLLGRNRYDTEMPAKRILLLYYSQSGDVAQIMETFVAPIKNLPNVELTLERVEPTEPYPFPWRTLTGLLSIFPECHRGGGAGIRPLSIRPDSPFDLVILGYQVWFLAPSLPIQDFFRSEFARVLQGAKVITLCVSRNMWQSGSETMKQLLRDAGASHLDNIVVNHQGPPFATFVSIPRASAIDSWVFSRRPKSASRTLPAYGDWARPRQISCEHATCGRRAPCSPAWGPCT